MSVPFRNTKYINGFVGKDRPIYGNELIQPGGYYPDGKCDCLTLTSELNPAFVVEMCEIDFYIGGELTSVYFSGDSSQGDEMRLHENYVINQPLSGVSYKAYQGKTDFGNDVFLFYVEDEGGYRWISSSDAYPYFNPIYSNIYNTSALSLSYPNNLESPDIIYNIAYPPNRLNSSPNDDYLVSFNLPCVSNATPTPTPTAGAFTPTPTQTPLPTITPTITPSISPTRTNTPTPSITPSPTTCNCIEYEITNENEGLDVIGWLDCNYNYQQQNLDSGFTLLICACAGSVSSRDGNTIIDRGSCNLTPTPTPTITDTPAPTPSGYPYIYETFNCDNAVETRRFAANVFIPVGKVINGVSLTGCFEITGLSLVSFYDDIVLNEYTDCGSCPR